MLKTLSEQDKGLFDKDDTSDEELEPSHTDNYNGEANANQNLFQLEETLKTLVSEVTKMQSDIKLNNDQTSNLLSELTPKITSLYEPRLDQKGSNYSVLEYIQTENSAIKSENNFLREKIEIMTYTLSDLSFMNKVKAAKQDKESLLTAIRLIYDDSKARLPYGDQETNKIEGSNETNKTEGSNEANNAAFQTNYNKRKQPNINERISVTAETSSLRNNQYTVYCQPKNSMTPTK